MADIAKITSPELSHIGEVERKIVGKVFSSFLDTAGTATSRATFYNTLEELEKTTIQIHEQLFEIDRGIYGLSLVLPGVTDYTRQLGISRLLSNPIKGKSILTPAQELMLIHWLTNHLPPQRMLNLFIALKKSRVNNKRTRVLILRSILGYEKLEFWAVKYRHKLAKSLQHAWGERDAGIIKAILSKSQESYTTKENTILNRMILKYAKKGIRKEKVFECISFILGNEENLKLLLLKSYHDAKTKFEKGSKLPYEVLEGIRSQFHPDRKTGDVLLLSKKQLTTGQKLALQRKAKEEHVEVKFNPKDYDTVRLYLYAYEMGMTVTIKKELKRKAKTLAMRLPTKLNHIGILVDVSESMVGHRTQKRRPIAVTLAIRDVLIAASEKISICYSNGDNLKDFDLIEPAGETALAEGLVSLLQEKPDSIFILTDGYENTPAGRLNEAIIAARRIGVEIPIYQISPVMAAETLGVRALSEEIPIFPLNQPEAIGLGIVKLMMLKDVDHAIAALLNLIIPLLEEETRTILLTSSVI